jgi:hypothetical protein
MTINSLKFSTKSRACKIAIQLISVNVGFTLSQATKALRESRGIALLCFQTSALEGGEESASRPGRFLPPGNNWYPLHRRLGGPQDRSGQVRKISPTPGFDSRTVQPHSQSLYWLNYPAKISKCTNRYIWVETTNIRNLHIVTCLYRLNLLQYHSQ